MPATNLYQPTRFIWTDTAINQRELSDFQYNKKLFYQKPFQAPYSGDFVEVLSPNWGRNENIAMVRILDKFPNLLRRLIKCLIQIK